jgi:transcriptional regulator with XRE-family HTH domain
MRATETRRALKGLTQVELAELTSVHVNHLNQVLRGARRPSAPLVRRLAQALGCEMSDLIDNELAAS